MPPMKRPADIFQAILAALTLWRKRYYERDATNSLRAAFIGASSEGFFWPLALPLTHCKTNKISPRAQSRAAVALHPRRARRYPLGQALLKPPHWAYLKEPFSRPGSFTAIPLPVRHHIEEQTNGIHPARTSVSV